MIKIIWKFFEKLLKILKSLIKKKTTNVELFFKENKLETAELDILQQVEKCRK